MCPHLYGEKALTIEPTDNTYRRLLKARLRQDAEFVYRFEVRFAIGQYQSTEFFNYTRVLNDMRAVILELWANDSKNLIPRLEELVLLAKDAERWTRLRVNVGTDPPQQLSQAVAYRLEAEAVLWRVTHLKPAK
jgi:gamma-glutamylcyclotransferase (GGCT)/AIG2-like uncharacterized protein YtfP